KDQSDGFYFVNNGNPVNVNKNNLSTLKESMNGNTLIKKSSNTCTVITSNAYSGLYKNNILLIVNGSGKWVIDECSEIYYSCAAINSENRKQIIINNCKIVNGSEKGQELYYIAHYSWEQTLIRCNNNEDCTTTNIKTGYYNTKNGILICYDNKWCRWLDVNSSTPKYFINNGSNKSTYPLLRCINNKCTPVKASVGTYVNSGYSSYFNESIGGILINCSSSSVCKASSGIKDAGYLNQSDNKNRAPIILCNDSKNCYESNESQYNIYVDGSSVNGSNFKKIIKKVGNSFLSFNFANNSYSVNKRYYLNGAIKRNKYENVIIECTNGSCRFIKANFYRRYENGGSNYIYCTMIPKRCYHYINGVQKPLFSLKSFLSNNSVPLGLKEIILQSFVISKINYYAPLLGNSSNKKNKAFHERNSHISLYTLSRDLIIPLLVGICVTQQIKCFIKWRNSNCIIRDLVGDIPTIPLNNGIKALRYSNLQFKNSTSITRLGFQKPYLNLGIIWIIRIRCGFENTTRIAITSNKVTPDSYCPCFDHREQTFLHWILLCPALTQYRTTSVLLTNSSTFFK
ncbi:hypothetical protein PIROE2DRAFT_11386, partial [Piromyces sp. E2]